MVLRIDDVNFNIVKLIEDTSGCEYLDVNEKLLLLKTNYDGLYYTFIIPEHVYRSNDINRPVMTYYSMVCESFKKET